MSEIATWPDRLEAVMARTDGSFRRVFVLPETGSTQDAARRLETAAGDIVTTARQFAGRGRRGRQWEDTGADGVAVTFVLEPADPARLAIAAAVGVARALERFLAEPVGLKWPNDVVVDGRKLAGLLAEQAGGLTCLGIGVNVGQTAWPEALAGQAVSLRELGASAPRIEVLEAIVESLAEAIEASDASIRAAFAARDTLVGTVRTFQATGGTITGRILELDPMRGLAVEGPEGRLWLEAATTTIVRERSGSTGQR